MKKENLYPQDQVFWNLKNQPSKNLREKIKADVVVIGGGVAGLSAAQSFHEKGFSVVLLEKSFCGGGASGKSSGFVTPYAELGLQFFIQQYGVKQAEKIWELGTAGLNFIRKNIETYSINCDFQMQDVLVVANSYREFKKLEKDHQLSQKTSNKSSLYTKETIKSILGSDHYFGGIRYPDTFGINCYDYCQAMEKILKNKGVLIFEETPAIAINGDTVTTPYGAVCADHIIVCVDRFLPDLGGPFSREVFPVQTFIAVSEPLSAQEIAMLFPQGNLMLWDTDLIYTYFRLIDGNRLLVGGGDYVSISWGREQHNLQRMYNKLNRYIQRKFPYLNTTFSYTWPGLIGVSKDVIPVAGVDPCNTRVYYITCTTGLAWAAALGNYSAERITQRSKELDDFFYPRKYPIASRLQMFLGKRIIFSWLNFVNLYFRN